MKQLHHLQKIAKLEALRARLDPLQDFELWFWTGMTAGTHAVNAALHQAGVTVAEDAFATQPGVYLVPQEDGSLAAVLPSAWRRAPCGPPKGRGAGSSRHRCDDARDGNGRKLPRSMPARGLQPTQAIADQCDAALRRCLDLLALRLEEKHAA